MPALSVVWGFAKTIFGGVPLWVWPIAALALFAGVQTIRLEHAKTAIAATQSAFDIYKAQIATQAAADNAKAIEALKAAQAWNDVAVAKRLADAQTENAKLQAELMEIRNAPRENDAPPSRNACAYYGRVYGQQAC